MLLFTSLALAADYEAEAVERMKLGFDLDDVRAELAAPAAAPPAPDQPARAALPLEPNSTLERVVVLRDRAIVTRTRTTEVPAGESRLRFEGLPLGVDASSLHAELRSGDGRIVAVEVVAGAGDVEETERITAIRAEATALSDELGRVRDRLEALLLQRDYLRSALLPAGDHPLPTLDTVKGSLAWLGDAERDLAKKLRAEELQAEQLGKKLSPLLVKLADPRATGATVRVDLDRPASGPVTVALRYTVGGASWWPTYAARLDEATRAVTLETSALVRQTTGEAWTNATIELSTANPQVGGAAPELSAWILDESGVDGASLAVQGSARSGAGALTVAVPGKRSIAGDGSEARIPLSSRTAPTTLSLTTVPREELEVFRAAQVTWTGETPLLPGEVASFVDGDYVGSAIIGAVAPGAELELGFGVDDRVEVKRALMERKVENLVGGRVRYTLRYRTTLHNYAKDPRTVTVSDQLPVSQWERITVTPIDGTPATPDPDAPAGVQRWRVEVPAGTSRTLDFGFVVTAPRELATRMDMMLM